MQGKEPLKIKMKFTGRGTVKNPDGTKKDFTMTGEKLVTEEEAKRHGYDPKCSG